ncbi:MAG: YicC/YloC family endoribonuclease [Myxococcota bacterium]|jgi:uncharacterized protein (TIGR00255 family)
MTIKSMTGYGMASAGTGFTAEIKSVNHKFLEIRLHLPADLQPAEPMILEHMRRILKRGSVEVILSRCGDSTVSVRKPRLNRELAKRYIDMALELKKMSGDQGTVDLSTLLTMKDLIDYEVSESDVTEVMNAIRPALDAACGRYDEMRTREGEAVGAALLRFLDNIESKTAVIETEAPKSIVAYREKLASRIAQIRGDVQPDSYRLEQEVAYCAEKCDVAEEIDRSSDRCSPKEASAERRWTSSSRR